MSKEGLRGFQDNPRQLLRRARNVLAVGILSLPLGATLSTDGQSRRISSVYANYPIALACYDPDVVSINGDTVFASDSKGIILGEVVQGNTIITTSPQGECAVAIDGGVSQAVQDLQQYTPSGANVIIR